MRAMIHKQARNRTRTKKTNSQMVISTTKINIKIIGVLKGNRMS